MSRLRRLFANPQEVNFFLFLGLFALVIGIIYWFASYEAAGTVLLLGFAHLLFDGLKHVTQAAPWIWGRLRGGGRGTRRRSPIRSPIRGSLGLCLTGLALPGGFAQEPLFL